MLEILTKHNKENHQSELTSSSNVSSNLKREKWVLDSWKKCKISQQPKYEDSIKLEETLKKLRLEKELITDFKMVDALNEDLCSFKNKFLLIAGDCAEPFEDKEKEVIYKKCAFLNALGQLLNLKLNKKVVLIGRIAGQFAKPRSADTEVINGGKSSFAHIYIDIYIYI